MVPLVSPGRYVGIPHPSIDAALVCIATAILLATRLSLLEQGPLARVLAWFGDISYSLYLVHWPIVAFANNAYMLESQPIQVRLTITFAAIILGYAVYGLVEKPLRFAPRRRIVGAMFAMTAIAGCTWAWQVSNHADEAHATSFALRLEPNFGLSDACEFGAAFVPSSDCMTDPRPTILVWGDSYAMHLVPGLAAANDVAIAQATKSVCGPFLGIVPDYSHYKRGAEWTDDCWKFNRSVMNFLARNRSIEIVVLSSILDQYLYKPVIDANRQRKNYDSTQLADALTNTADALRELGKRVLFIAPPPSEGTIFAPKAGFEIGLCLERKTIGLVTAGPHADCRIDRAIFKRREARMLAFLEIVEMRNDVPVYRFEPDLCDKRACLTEIDDIPIYRDRGHFSREGSVLLFNRFGVLDEILRRAK